jgi:hypothetical protein
MEFRVRNATVVIGSLAASAGAHAGLVPAHLEHETRLGAAFALAALAALVVAAALTFDQRATYGAVVLLAALIGAYVLNVTLGIPVLAEGPEPTDAVGLTTKAVEAVGLLFALHLIPTTSGLGPLTDKEARP